MKRVLMIAFHFPPFTGSSGVQRTLRFVQHLRSFEWEPLVLSAHPSAYEHRSNDLLAEVPSDVIVSRAFALDVAKHLSVRGRYLAAMARPDRWANWRYAGVRSALKLIAKAHPQVLWSTYPIASAHCIAARVQRITGIPWIADFRDPMVQVTYPRESIAWRYARGVEEQTVTNARFITCTTAGAERLYKERYPGMSDRIVVVENGYDEESFSRLTGDKVRTPLNSGAITLLHSGYVYPSERDPSCLFRAVRQSADKHLISERSFKLRFRAAGSGSLLPALAERHGVGGFCEFLPLVSYTEALEEMQRADGLVILQSTSFNAQIPAKLYEYLRARRPILGLTDPIGNTATVLRSAGITTVAPIDSPDHIERTLQDLLNGIRSGMAPLPQADYVARCSRRSRTSELVTLLSRAQA